MIQTESDDLCAAQIVRYIADCVPLCGCCLDRDVGPAGSRILFDPQAICKQLQKFTCKACWAHE